MASSYMNHQKKITPDMSFREKKMHTCLQCCYVGSLTLYGNELELGAFEMHHVAHKADEIEL